jgi:hypothetical protein
VVHHLPGHRPDAHSVPTIEPAVRSHDHQVRVTGGPDDHRADRPTDDPRGRMHVRILGLPGTRRGLQIGLRAGDGLPGNGFHLLSAVGVR